MPNPYYVTPRSNILAEPTRQAMQLLQLKQQAEAGRAELSQKERHYQQGLPIQQMQAETARTQAGTARIGAETAGVQAETAQSKAQTEEGRTRHRQPYEPIEYATTFKKIEGSVGREAAKALEPISGIMKFAATQNVTKGQAADMLVDKNYWPSAQQKGTENLKKLIDKKIDQPGWLESAEGQAVSQIYNIIAKDTTGEMTQRILFGPTLAARAAEQELLEIERMKAQPTLRAPTYKELGGNIYELGNGVSTIIQKGSIDERAITNAMKDPFWQFADEAEQAQLIEKHKRYVTGKTQKKSPKKDYGASDQPEGKTATNAQGIKIITKKGRWVLQ